jgi:spermidine synthase
VIEVLVGISAAGSIPLFGWLYGAFVTVAAAVPDGGLPAKIATKLAVSFVIMLVPTLLMGAAFPLVSALYVGPRRRVGRGVGTLYALNTLGAIVGSSAAGFFIIPAFGLQGGILFCASVFLAIGLALLSAAPRRPAARGVAWATCAAVLAGTAWLNFRFEGAPLILQSGFFKNPGSPHKLVYSHEGGAASLTVVENAAGTKLLNINGITTAINNYMDMQVHRMLSHLPMLMHPDPREVLVVGFGMGSTPWGCCQHPEVERVDVVELLRAEKQTAPIFADINHNVIDHPKLRFIEGDGRNFLLGTRDAYDVISFNAIHPRYSPYLYTLDFYELCRARLSADGVICAWLTQNSMTEAEFRMLCRSFTDVFEHSTLWYCNPEHFCLVGTMQPTRIDLDELSRRMAVPPVRADLADSNLAQPSVLAARLLIGGAALADYVAGAPLNTDDRARIEFSRETKDAERPIIARLADLSRAARPREFFSGSDEALVELAAHQQAFDMLAAGQIEHWYPRVGPLASEIAWRRALLITPNNQDIRHNLGFSDLILRQIEQELARHPDNPAALAGKGAVLTELGRFDEATESLVRALKINPLLVPAVERLAFAQLLNGQPAESVPWFQGLLMKAKPDDPRLLYGLSVAFEEMGESDEAAACRLLALRAEPARAEWFELWRQTIRTMAATGPGRN